MRANSTSWCLAAICFASMSVITTAASAIDWSFAGSSNVFGGRQAPFAVAVRSDEAFRGVLQWRLTANRRTLDAGEIVVDVDAGETILRAMVRVPNVKDGVVLHAEFSANLGATDESPLQQSIWIFPEDAFDERSEWLRKLNLAVYDPEGQTIDTLKEFKIPFRTCRNFASIRELKHGILIVGEGVSLVRRRGLSNLLLEKSSQGLHVLCLAPKDGHFPMADNEEARRLSFSLKGSQALSELDKRFDVARWGDHPAVICRLRHRAVGSQVFLEANSEPKSEGFRGWPWWEVKYESDSGEPGSLLVCGFGIVKHWEQAPTSRFVFAKLLESRNAVSVEHN